MKIMKYLNKLASVFFIAAFGMLMVSCEGGDLFDVNAPDWLADMGQKEEDPSSIVETTPNPTKLGEANNTTAWWTVFTDDIKAEPGKTYQIKFTNFGGASNWNNFVLILRNEAKDVEYAVLRADNWGWGTGYSGEESDAHFAKKMESDDRDWATWLKAMSRAKCTMNIYNYGDGTADVKVTMLGSDGNTYTQEYTGVSVDKDNLYFAFTVDNSHIEFGDVDVKDSEPVAMKLNGVAAKVKLGTSFEDAFANVTATVTFADGVAKEVEGKDLQIQAVPDMNSVGKKTLVAVYNKTYLGENADTPIVGTAEFEIVDKMYKTVGATDNTGAFWSDHSEAIKVNPGETFVSYFTNYTAGGDNWNNFLVVLATADGTTEYSVLRADNFGWGTGYDASIRTTEEGRDWAEWIGAMDGAKVTTFVTNNGDGTADVKAIMVGNNGKTYEQNYKGINNVDPNNFYFHFTIEKAHLEFDAVTGDENNTGAFWSAHSPAHKVEANQTFVTRFTNYTAGGDNWNNFLVVLATADGTTEYSVLRADNFGWGTGYDASIRTTEEGRDWAEWIGAMDGAQVTAYVTNNGDGTADVKAIMVGNNGKTYEQNYKGINNVDSNNFYFHFTIEKAHLVFE